MFVPCESVAEFFQEVPAAASKSPGSFCGSFVTLKCCCRAKPPNLRLIYKLD